MASNTSNGFEAPTLFVPESPFLETPALPTAEAETTGLEDRFLELDSPFLRDTYAQEAPSPLEAEFARHGARLRPPAQTRCGRSTSTTRTGDGSCRGSATTSRLTSTGASFTHGSGREG